MTESSWVGFWGANLLWPGSGTTTGTTRWTARVPLAMGPNDITVTALDAAGNIATDVLSVKRRPN